MFWQCQGHEIGWRRSVSLRRKTGQQFNSKAPPTASESPELRQCSRPLLNHNNMRHFFVLSLLVFAFITSVSQQTEKHTLYFNYGKDQLTSGSAGKLDNLLRELDTADVLQVHLEGHTDSDGSDAYNLKLSSRRVAFVLRYLIEKGISEGAI